MAEKILKNVVVTGIGCVTPVGTGRQELWKTLVSGKSGISEITRFDIKNFPVKVAGEVKDFYGEDFVDKKDSTDLPLFILYAVASAKLAMMDASLPNEFYTPERTGIFSGCGAGGFDVAEKAMERMMSRKTFRLSPYFIPHFLPNMAAGIMAIHLGIKGETLTFANACAAGSSAIGEAYLKIRNNNLDLAVAGGTEAIITKSFIAGLSSMKALSKKTGQNASSPFDRFRDGFVVSEGSAFLILENEENALKRGAKIYARIKGYGSSNDAFHLVAPDPEGKGMATSMTNALKSADLKPEDIDYINAHGTSTEMNDRLETKAIKNIFKSHAKNLIISSTKSMTGHLLGASGALEAAVSALSIYHQTAHPTINLTSPDPECDLNYLPVKACRKNMRFAISNSFGFGGVNNSIIFEKVI